MTAARLEPPGAAVVWHDCECGAYTADLDLWRGLAARAARRDSADVLDLGCGTGRVALDLAARGHRVTGLDADAEVAAELRRRAEARNLATGAVVADARDFDLGRRFDLVLAPMQLMQLFAGPAERIAVLARARAHVRPRGLFATALLDIGGEAVDADYVEPLPDMREAHGWVWSSRPVAMRLEDGGAALRLERRRRAVSPAGEVAESDSSVRLQLVEPAELEGELREAGLRPLERQWIGPTDDHVGSVVLIAEGADG